MMIHFHGLQTTIIEYYIRTKDERTDMLKKATVLLLRIEAQY